MILQNRVINGEVRLSVIMEARFEKDAVITVNSVINDSF